MYKKRILQLTCFLVITLLFSFYSFTLTAQTVNSSDLPVIVKKDGGGYQLLVDGMPFIVLGAQLWNSSDWPYILDKEWPQLKELHCNTLEAPIYWQNIEPQKEEYNFSELDSLINGARKEGLRLILLWFGSYKNGGSQYAPIWVLNHPEKYPRMLNSHGEEMQVLSAVATVNLEADKHAFAAVMHHIRSVDGQEHTVILVQVENEPGSLGTDRDYSPLANIKFREQVPSSLLHKMGKQPGTWEEVFGRQSAEAFNAYYIAHYINEVAEAGKNEYSLPMYTNAWLRENGFRRPGEYPSGGAVSTMIPMWKAAAPALSLLSPDIYLANHEVFKDICTKYSRPDNPLFIPEMGKGTEFARYQFYALGNFNALGVATYGIDPFGTDPTDERDKEKLDKKFRLIADNYHLLRGAMGKISELQGTGHLKAVGEEPGLHEQLVNMGDYDILFSFGYPTYKKTPLTGRALIGELDKDEFLIIGFDTKFRFRPKYDSGYSSTEYLMIEEGYYENDKWVKKRIWNGDEAYHSTLTPDGNILRIRLRKVKK